MGGIEAGNSLQDSRGARRRLLTVAVFQPWRGSQSGVARGPQINVPYFEQPHKSGPRRRNSAPRYGGFRIQGTTSSPHSATKKRIQKKRGVSRLAPFHFSLFLGRTDRVGFEPTRLFRPTRVPVVLLKPLGHLSSTHPGAELPRRKEAEIEAQLREKATPIPTS